MALALVQPDETALDLFASLRRQLVDCGLPFDIAALPDGHVHPGDLVEVHGASGVGKTALLCAAASCAAATSASGRATTEVVYLDLDGRVPLHRIVAGVERHLGADAPSAEIGSCCRRIGVARCTDIVELLATLARLRTRTRELRCDDSLLVIMDGLGSRFWLDKAETGGNPYERVAAALAELVKTRRVAVLVSTAAVIEGNARDGASAALARLAKARIVLQSPAPARWPSSTVKDPVAPPPDRSQGMLVHYTITPRLGGAAVAHGSLLIGADGVDAHDRSIANGG